MSYILDALQRAEADRERERGAVPGLQTRSVLPGSMPVRQGQRLGLGVIAAAAVAVVALMAVMFWFWPSAERELAAPVVQAPAAQTLTPSVVIAPTPVAVANRTVVAVTALPQRPPETPKRAEAPPAPTRATSRARVATEVPLFKDMPEEFRRQVPALAISGAVYSENPAQRLLLVNGQVLSQGSPAAQDVTLEEIHPTTSEFSFKGMRFRLPH